MARARSAVFRWGPALVCMAAIYIASATPDVGLPHFGALDSVMKKGGHFLAYGVLALTYRRGLGTEKGKLAGAWLLAVIYALLDEFHQSFVPGRHPSLVDAFLFDGGGAMTALLISTRFARLRRPASEASQDAAHSRDHYNLSHK